jgi:hypothetical protein
MGGDEYPYTKTNGMICFSPPVAGLIASRLQDRLILIEEMEVYKVKSLFLESNYLEVMGRYTNLQASSVPIKVLEEKRVWSAVWSGGLASVLTVLTIAVVRLVGNI